MEKLPIVKVLICDALQDITNMDCLVNSTNKNMVARAGFDLKVRKSAGDGLKNECKKIGALEKNKPIITEAYGLSNYKRIIHISLHSWKKEKIEECEKQYQEAYNAVLQLALDNNVRTIVFPPIGMKYHKVPDSDGIRIAVNSVKNFILEHPNFFESVYFVTNEIDAGKAKLYCIELEKNDIAYEFEDLIADSILDELCTDKAEKKEVLSVIRDFLRDFGNKFNAIPEESIIQWFENVIEHIKSAAGDITLDDAIEFIMKYGGKVLDVAELIRLVKKHWKTISFLLRKIKKDPIKTLNFVKKNHKMIIKIIRFAKRLI